MKLTNIICIKEKLVLNVDIKAFRYMEIFFSSNESSKLSVNDENITYSVWISFAEIYNEQVPTD